jgi:translocation and assembly module TamB
MEQRLELHFLQGRYKEYPLTLTQPTVIKHSSDGYTTEGFVLQVGPGYLQATGNLNTQAIAIIINWEHLPLEALRSIGIPDFTGEATGRLDITGQLDHPQGSIQLHFTDVRLRDDAFKTLPPATVTSKAELRQGQLQATLSIEGLAEKPLKANIQLPVQFSLSPFTLSLQPRGEVRGQFTAEVNLAHTPTLLYLEDQSLEGYLTIDLSLSGRAEAPEITGHARIVKTAYENTRTGTILKDIHIQMRAKDRKIFIEEARATDSGTGAISAQGWFEFIPGKDFPFQFDVHLNKADLVRQDDVTGTVSGHVSLSGSLVDPVVTGKVDIGPADIQIPDRLPPEITELEVVEINRPGQETEPQETLRMRKPRRLRLDLQLNFPGRLFIRGRGLDSEWKGALEVKGKMKEPLVMGTLNVVRGHLNLFGKRFVLTKGNLAFNGNIPPSPNFDVIGEHKRSDITARVQLRGTPSAIVVTLESDPPLPEDEILARVLFGRSVTNVTPVQALQLAHAVNTLAGGGGGILDVMDRTRKLLGVERLDIKQAGELDGKAALSIGKYLMEGVYFEVDKVVGTGLDPEGDKVSVEVEITPNITVETEAGVDGQGGVGLNWKWDY